MRLKYLFFPIMLVISLSIFVGFIWPEIGNVKQNNGKIIASQDKLQVIKDQQMAIESIGKKVSDGAAGEKIVSEYLPSSKVEDRIIGGVNYLATDANVSLINISLTNTTTVPSLADVSVVSATPEQQAQIKPTSLQSTTAKISLVGDYDKIEIFLDNLQRMPIFNTIKSVSIAHQLANSADTADNTNGSGLLANIEVDFGYLAVAKVSSAQSNKIDSSIDSKTIESLNKYVSQKSQLTISKESEAGSKGKVNPFLIN